MITRRKVLAISALVLLAGCKVIPRGAPDTTPPPEAALSDVLPTDAQRHRVALLVPMSGTNAAVGQSLSNATQMALLDTNAQNLRITTYDTSLGAANAAARAVSEGNRLILGPLLAGDMDAVTTVARPARVPVISYTNDTTVAARDAFIMGTTTGNSIERTVRFARARGLNRFAALIPTADYGQRVQAVYGEIVRAAGGTLVSVETYDRSNTSVVSAARRLRARGGFDAVLIADTARFAVLAAPQLKTAGAASPRILGTELWSGESTIGTTPALRGAWYSVVPDTRFRQFADSYLSRFGARPHRIATLGYDSVLLTIRVARDWRPGTTFPPAKLADRGGFLGLDGPFRFFPTGVVERSLEVREARAGGVAVADAAPARFAD